MGMDHCERMCDRDSYCPVCHQFEGCCYPKLPPSIRRTRPARCFQCGREVFLVDISTACLSLGINSKTLYRWRRRGWVTCVIQSNGRPLIYWTSLFEFDFRESSPQNINSDDGWQ